ncbi:MAG: AAA family ATPase, partial [Chloroflexota bacterium]|nr:AAA family ATPase [Chloroflexota bacterium]
MKEGDLEHLAKIAEFECSNPKEKEWPIGWSWQQVRIWTATLNRLLVEGCLEVEYSSSNYTGYR